MMHAYPAKATCDIRRGMSHLPDRQLRTEFWHALNLLPKVDWDRPGRGDWCVGFAADQKIYESYRNFSFNPGRVVVCRLAMHFCPADMVQPSLHLVRQ